MKSSKKTVNYMSKIELLEEIIASKEIQKKYPDRRPSECITGRLAFLIDMIVEKYGNHKSFRNYSYIDDMKSEAKLALCQSALKFDPELSQNPFGYYTMIIHRVFLTFLDKEKVQRKIKDELIEIYGENLKPSMSRQQQEELERLGKN